MHLSTCAQRSFLSFSDSFCLSRLPLADGGEEESGVGELGVCVRGISCSPALSHNRFMGAGFSKYLAFPLYRERLMAFDVGVWGVKGKLAGPV